MSVSACAEGADFSLLDASRLAVLSNETCQGIVVRSFNRSAIPAMTPACVENWYSCSEMLPETLPMLSVAQVSAINLICIRDISANGWKNATAQTIGALSDKACDRVRSWEAIPPQAFAGMTTACFSRLGFSTSDPCSKFPKLAAVYIPGVAFRSVAGNCFVKFSPDFISMLPITSIGNLTKTVTADYSFYPAVKYMSPLQIQALAVEVLIKPYAPGLYPGMNQYVNQPCPLTSAKSISEYFSVSCSF